MFEINKPPPTSTWEQWGRYGMWSVSYMLLLKVSEHFYFSPRLMSTIDCITDESSKEGKFPGYCEARNTHR
jgi:hypothetical protein